ncbi:hypothetical protein AWC27_16760 [Mycobacterium szulgai]|uniref:Uncharacterized protein n=1 Tax=Mycobacterium szulgai TaxID=1787 RepID=A0A1X2FKW0_MYCSZ|nr:hypothetical protein AWC27_16760 [Mycobacterium szulgai]
MAGWSWFLSGRLDFGGSVEPVEVGGYAVKFVGVEVAIDVRGDGSAWNDSWFLDIAKFGA